MARQINRLSARRVETLEAAGRHADGGGLYLSISPNGGRRWIFLYRWNGKQTEMGLGSARSVALAEARSLASEARSLIARGVSPLEAKRRTEAEQTRSRAPTFGECADALIQAMGPSWRNEKHRRQWEVTLGRRPAAKGAGSYAMPLSDKAVDAISTEDVLGVLRPIWQAKAETASRLRGRIEAVLDAARAQGHRIGENLARWRGHLDKLLPKPKKLVRGHHAAMPFDEVPAFVGELRGVGSVSSAALEFLVLTATRSGEVREARWIELDVEAKLWVIPALRMKGGREHRVPLCRRCLEILADMQLVRRGEFVFPGSRGEAPLSVMAMAMQMRRLGKGGFTPHGFRSAFRDWVGECTTFPREVAETALAHQVGGEVERAYRRGDALQKRAELMKAWAEFIEPRGPAKIVGTQVA